MRFISFALFCSSLSTALISSPCSASPPSVMPIGISDFSGAETLITFGGITGPTNSFTVDGVIFTDDTEGFIQLQEGGAVPDSLFSNIPGVSKGGYGRTTATGLLKLLIELPAPAHRFGMLLSAGGPFTYQVTAMRGSLNLGSIIATQPGQRQAVFAGIESSLSFRKIIIEQIFTSGFAASAFDDLRYELVPEPTAIAMLCLGSVCLVWRWQWPLT